MEAHHLHHHLVGVGGAVEGAGALAVIARGLSLQQLLAARLALGIELADARLLLVGEARRHRAARDEDRRQMAEAKRADQHARHDLIANPEQQRALEHRVAERHSRRQRDRVAAEQRQFHAHLALGHAVAHGGNAARDLGGRAHLARGDFDLLRIAGVGRVRGQHVVIGGDDADVRTGKAADSRLVLARARETVREVAAAHRVAVDALLALPVDMVEIGLARGARTLDDPFGDGGDGWMHCGQAKLRPP